MQMMLNWKSAVNLLLLAVLLFAIPVAVTLMRQEQIFKSKATVETITFAGSNVQLKNGKIVAVDKDIQVKVISPFEEVEAPAADIAAENPFSPAQPGDGDNVTIRFTKNTKANFVMPLIDSADPATQSSPIQLGPLGSCPVDGCIFTWPSTHARHTPGTHTLGVLPYYCESGTFSSECVKGVADYGDRITISGIAAGGETLTPTTVPSSTTCSSIGGSCVNSNRITASGQTCFTERKDLNGNCTGNYPYCYTNCQTSSRTPSVSIRSGVAGMESTIRDNQNLVINFNRNTDVNAVNIIIDGVEEGAPLQKTFSLTGGASDITWPNTHSKHTQGAHTVGIKGYYCPDATLQGCTPSGVDTRTVTIISNGQSGVIKLEIGLGRVLAYLRTLLPKFEMAKEVYATATCETGGVYSSCKLDCPGTESAYGSYCYYSTKSNAEQGTCEGVCPPVPTTVPPSPTRSPVNCRIYYAEPEENCIPGTYMTDEERAARDPFRRTPTPTQPAGTTITLGVSSPTPGTSSPVPQVILAPLRTRTEAPAGTDTKFYKISEVNSDAAWSVTTAHAYTVEGENISDYQFTPVVCVTTPCDTYPRGNRRVYVQFIGQKPNSGGEYKEVWSADIVLGLKPVITSAACSVPGTGTGTSLTLKGQHFADEAGSVTLGGVAVTVPTGSWNNLEIGANSTQGVTEDKDVVVTTLDGQASDPIKCCVGKSIIDFKAMLSCRSSEKPLSVADVEIHEDTPQSKSVYKKQAVEFDAEGRPQGLIPELTEGKSYKIIVKTLNALSKVVKFTAGVGTSGLETMSLPLGDVAPDRGDCQINQLDRSRLLSEWAAGQDSTKKSDLNLDGRVNSLDYYCLMSNFRKECERI